MAWQRLFSAAGGWQVGRRIGGEQVTPALKGAARPWFDVDQSRIHDDSAAPDPIGTIDRLERLDPLTDQYDASNDPIERSSPDQFLRPPRPHSRYMARPGIFACRSTLDRPFGLPFLELIDAIDADT